MSRIHGETEEQCRFFDELLVNYPRLAKFWDRSKREFRDEAADAAMGVLSPGEAVALKALASIWLGNAAGDYMLDITQLAALSPDWRKPLVKWFVNPFFP